MKELIHNINNLINIKMYEIDYITSCPEYIDIRLYGDYRFLAKHLVEQITKKFSEQIKYAEVYMPHQDIVKYAFSGNNFTGIEIEVDTNNIIPLHDDYMLMEKNAYERKI